jgi:hypothetical protein
MKHIITVNHKTFGEVELDIDRIIAIAPKNNGIIFENTVWKLDDDDFEKVRDAWNQLKQKTIV